MHDKKELSEYIHFLYNLVIKNKSGKKEVNTVKKISMINAGIKR